MRRMNPDNLMDSAKDVGVAAALALPAAAIVGLGAFGASKIEYAPEASGDLLSPASKRAAVVAAGAIALGVAMQFSKSTAMIGKAIGVLGIGIPTAMLVQAKAMEMSAPAAPATSSGFYGVSGGMPGFGQSSYIPMALPVGAQPSGMPNFTPAAFVPVVR